VVKRVAAFWVHVVRVKVRWIYHVWMVRIRAFRVRLRVRVRMKVYSGENEFEVMAK
jgi:hypothetical protein